MKKMNLKLFLFLSIFIVSCLSAEDKWVWSSANRDQDESNKNRGIDDRQDRLFARIRVPVDRYQNDNDRYDVREPTTKRPDLDRPQDDEFYNEFGPSPDDPRGNGYGGGSYGNPFNSGRLPQGFGPNYSPVAPPGPVQPFSGVASPGQSAYPNAPNGILVGPGGPTGIIGRPNRYLGSRGNAANGVLVGPGGPTGIIGRPPYYSATGPVTFPAVGLNGIPPAGIYPNQFANPGNYPGQFGPGQFGPGQFGPGQFGPGQFGPGQFGPGQFGPGQFGPGQFGPGQFGAAQFGPGAGGILPYNNNIGGGGLYASGFDVYDGKTGVKSTKDTDRNKNILKRSIKN